ncbi:hypothetical protein SAMN05216298_3493 [Glycomyces sambucus]|uniref:Uncharacterized protein n=1 Tax=Glycomyces sambucus TaxID=380244 RepID=A0A1G9J8J1_9ACTN|nr:hypothetical protein [Glycomyces sambucus]SDL33870.1 hypothetical protein SAMN05216298_3493 [Glycomyces sambucus]
MSNPSTDDKPSDLGERLFGKVGMAVVIEVLAGLVIAFLGLQIEFDDGPPDETTSLPDYEPVEDVDPEPVDPIEDEQDQDEEVVEEEPDEPAFDAAVGDCFLNQGSEDAFDLVDSYCDPGAFEVVDVYDGGSTGDCDSVDRSMFGFDPGSGRVLCLSYLHPWGDAYYAESGECVGRGGDSYVIASCDVGNYQVLERLWGGEDANSCSEWEYYNGSLDFPGYIGEQDLLLCMRIVYPDDMGYAQLDNCLYTSGEGNGRTFAFADCSQANAYVTGRTGEYDTAFCGSHGSAYWQSDPFPEHAYTVCWNWL